MGARRTGHPSYKLDGCLVGGATDCGRLATARRRSPELLQIADGVASYMVASAVALSTPRRHRSLPIALDAVSSLTAMVAATQRDYAQA